MHTAIIITLAALCIAATITDLKSQRIPNLLTFPAMLIFLALHFAAAGWDGLVFSAIGLGAGFALLIVPHAIGVMGAGDVKFLMAAGAALGWNDVIWAFLLASVAGGVYALIVMLLARGAASRLITSLKNNFLLFAATGRIGVTPGGNGLPRLCYGVALAIGALSVMAYRVYPAFAA